METHILRPSISTSFRSVCLLAAMQKREARLQIRARKSRFAECVAKVLPRLEQYTILTWVNLRDRQTFNQIATNLVA